MKTSDFGKNVGALLLASSDSIASGDYSRAETILQKILQHDPENDDARALLAEIFLYRDDESKAMSLIKEVLNNDITHFQARYLLGQYYYGRGHLDMALGEYNELLHHHPEHPRVLNNMGIVYFEKNLHDRALECFERSLSANEDAKTYCNMGIVLFEKDEQGRAKECFENSIRIDPDSIIAHYYLGGELENKGQWKIGSLLKMGSLLRMKPLGEKEEEPSVFSVRLEDFDEESITISAPLHRGVPLPLRPGMRIIMGVAKSDALYGFVTEVVERKGGQRPVLRIRRKPVAKRIQRRNFVRIHAAVHMEIKGISPDSISGLVIRDEDIYEKNISLGGMLLVLPIKCPRESLLDLHLQLPDGQMNVVGQVVRCRKQEEGPHFELGCSFLGLDERKINRLSLYVNNRILDLRKKGLM